MTNDIIDMARQAGFELTINQHGNTQFRCFSRELERFAKLAAAKEREACAKIADSWKPNVIWENKMIATNLAKEIRARGNP